MKSISLDGQIAVKTGFTLKDHIWKAGSYFIDELNILLTPDKKCSVLLEKDHFDGAAYSIDDFFERVKHCFDNPELFYKIFQPPSEECVQQLHRKNANGFTVYSFPSPVQTPWHANNTAYYRFFSKSSSDNSLSLTGCDNESAITCHCSKAAVPPSAIGILRTARKWS